MQISTHAAQGGSTDTFQAEAAVLLQELRRSASQLTRHTADADDLVQETYLRAVRFAHHFTPGTNLKGWLFTILRNTARNAWRNAGRDPVRADSQTVDRATAAGYQISTVEEHLDRLELARLVRAALGTLPGPVRETLWLHAVEEHSCREIAARLGVPMGTVMSRISRGRRLVQERMTRQGVVGRSGRRRRVARRVPIFMGQRSSASATAEAREHASQREAAQPGDTRRAKESCPGGAGL